MSLRLVSRQRVASSLLLRSSSTLLAYVVYLLVDSGNDGAQGAWYTASPASGNGVIAVGSVEK